MSAYLNALYEAGSREDLLREIERQWARAIKAEAKIEDPEKQDDKEETMDAYLVALCEEGSRVDLLREIERQWQRALKAEGELEDLEKQKRRYVQRPQLVHF